MNATAAIPTAARVAEPRGDFGAAGLGAVFEALGADLVGPRAGHAARGIPAEEGTVTLEAPDTLASRALVAPLGEAQAPARAA